MIDIKKLIEDAHTFADESKASHEVHHWIDWFEKKLKEVDKPLYTKEQNLKLNYLLQALKNTSNVKIPLERFYDMERLMEWLESLDIPGC